MKERGKQLANAVALGLVFIPWLIYRIESWLFGNAKVFPGWSQLFSLLPGLSGVYLRRAFYRLGVDRLCQRLLDWFWNGVFAFHGPHWQESVHRGVLLHRRSDD